MSLINDFARTMKNELRLFPAYPLPRTVELGDYGTMDGSVWTRVGNLRDLKTPIDVSSVLGDAIGKYEFSSQGVSATKVKAGASIVVEGFVTVKPSLLLEFNDDFGVFFAASGCKWNTVKNLQQVGDELVRRANLDKGHSDYWHHGAYRVVTGVIESANTTLVIASKRGAKMLLSAKAEIPFIDMADIDLELGVDIQRDVYFKLVTEQRSMTPLLQLHHVNHSHVPWESDGFDLTKALPSAPSTLTFSAVG